MPEAVRKDGKESVSLLPFMIAGFVLSCKVVVLILVVNEPLAEIVAVVACSFGTVELLSAISVENLKSMLETVSVVLLSDKVINPF